MYFDGSKDHSDAGFIEAGAEAGEKAKNMITISGIKYNFKFVEPIKQNLLAISNF